MTLWYFKMPNPGPVDETNLSNMEGSPCQVTSQGGNGFEDARGGFPELALKDKKGE